MSRDCCSDISVVVGMWGGMSWRKGYVCTGGVRRVVGCMKLCEAVVRAEWSV